MRPTLPFLRIMLFLGITTCLQARVLDNFDDNTKTGWTDFTFQPGFGIPTETGKTFRFEQPPAGQSIFSASQKTSESFELKEGRTIEMRVDVTQTGGKDSFAVLAFIPTGNSPGTLAGYGLSKSRTDVLMSKGINRYFAAEGWPPTAVPDAASENITLVLIMRASGGNVYITGKILDKAKNNAVLWEKTVIDTPNADQVLPQGDQPKEPFIGQSGYFTLYLYQDYSSSAPENPYFVVYDNAEVFVTESVTVDDFNDNVKTDWKDFTFQPGFGIPTETGGRFRFEQPAAGQSIFSASQKTTRAFDLKEGERLEFRVDVEETGGKDSFAILAYLPTANSPGTLSGYGLAKSTTDVLMTKGINRYFAAEGWPPTSKPNAPSAPVTLALLMEGRDGNVIVTGRILDKANNDAVLWEKTVIDTPNADQVLPQGDQPKEPFINSSGYFTLYLYQDFSASAPENPYFVVYDNAVASAPPAAANVAPSIQDAQPVEYANFLPANTSISFKATDDKPLADSQLAITLNGTRYTSTNGLTLSAAGAARTATLAGKLATNTTYVAVLEVQDSDGEKTTQTIYFDTFAPENLQIEVEDYNFNNGSYLDKPTLTAEDPTATDPVDGSYRNQVGVEGVDFHDTRTAPRLQDAPYRKSDPVRMSRSLDYPRTNYVAAGGTAAEIYDYDVGDIVAGEWLNYTRKFPTGSYEVYLRESVVNLTGAQVALEQVTSGPTQSDQTTKPLGTFLGAQSGFKYRNFPLTDGTGTKKVVLRLSGETTLRLRQNTTDPEGTGLRENYLIFIPVQDAGAQPATISSISPTPGSSTETLTPSIRVEIQNQDTTVKTNSIQLVVNNQTVVPTITSNTNGAVVTFAFQNLPPSGTTNRARITFQDSASTVFSNEWSFVITYKFISETNRVAGSGKDRGLFLRFVQAPAGSGLQNNLTRAEDQLAPNSTVPKEIDVTNIVQVVNFNQTEGDKGEFPGDEILPGLTDANGTDDFAVEIYGYLELSAGIHTFGVISDDGFKVSSGSSLLDRNASALDLHSGGPANQTFSFVVPAAGLYPFRMVWYERGGDAYAEWFSVDQTGAHTLINDASSTNAVKAFTSLSAPAFIVESSATVNGPYSADTTATINTSSRTITIPISSTGRRFYRLSAATAQKLTISNVSAAALTLTY